jgi:hypothetical protein
MTLGGPGGVFRHGAKLALGEALGGNSVSPVEAGAGVFPGDHGAEFDELPLGEALTQGGVKFVGDIAGRAGECGGKAENGFFGVIEVGARFELRQVVKLLLGDAFFSADGRVNVDSKGATDHQRDFELRQFFKVHGDDARRGGIEIES